MNDKDEEKVRGLEYQVTATIIHFYCHVISCATAARCVVVQLKPVAAADRSACGCGNVVQWLV